MGTHTVTKMATLRILAVLVAAHAAAHPVLPTSWTAETIEMTGPGKFMDGIEAYHFVAKPTPSNPSGIWSNYSGCQRLIYDEGGASSGPGQRRYLFKCHAVNCCYETQQGNHKEYQIPDIHIFGKDVPVTPVGKQTVTVFNETIETDGWAWKIPTLGTTTAYTTGNGTDVTLHLWQTELKVGNLTSVKTQFKNFREPSPSEMPAFLSQFYKPSHEECRLACPTLRAEGKLKKSYEEQWAGLP